MSFPHICIVADDSVESITAHETNYFKKSEYFSSNAFQRERIGTYNLAKYIYTCIIY